MKALQEFQVFDRTTRIGLVSERPDRRSWAATSENGSDLGVYPTQRDAGAAVTAEHDRVIAERMRLARAM